MGMGDPIEGDDGQQQSERFEGNGASHAAYRLASLMRFVPPPSKDDGTHTVFFYFFLASKDGGTHIVSAETRVSFCRDFKIPAEMHVGLGSQKHIYATRGTLCPQPP